jgi:8-hydroxy-5-deazaflavin:NADPH oxidoreductase
MTNIGVIGSGVVGQTLADGLIKHGHTVMRGSREPAKLADWKSKAGPNAHTGTFKETAQFGEFVILAVKGAAAEQAVKEATPEALAGKLVIDTTNPIKEGGPKGWVIDYFTTFQESLMERLQRTAADAHFVKAFSSVGAMQMINPVYKEGRPSMFICGNDAAAKQRTKELLTTLGWDTEDMGGVESARAIEPLCILWCIPGFARNEWTHAFKVLHKS